ncbi:MAG TPA: amino acid adenylation domain-containing protein, partial [Pyrinomonadaceae bacterium]
MSDSSINEQIESGILPEVVFDRELLEERAYWIDKLTPLLDQAYPSIDFHRVGNAEATQVEFKLGEESYRALMELTGGGDFLIYTVLISALKVCLRKYMGRSTVIAGSPARLLDAGRKQAPNVLPIIDELSDEQSFEDLLLAVRETLLEAYARQRYPFPRLLEDLELENSTGQPHFFEITLGLKNIHVDLPALNGNLQIVFEHLPGQLAGQVVGQQSRTTVERFINHYLNVLAASLANTEALIGELSILGEAERHCAIAEWNDTARAVAHSDLAEAFAKRAVLCPDSVAVIAGDSHTSYGELDRRSTQLANYLKDNCGVGLETRVGVFMGRSVEAVEAILGIIKAGGAYVPLDPGYPLERLAFMLEDAEIPVLLTLESQLDHLPSYWGQIVCVDRDREQFALHNRENPTVPSTGDNLAYVIYTSGSTGTPKGVAVTRRSVVRLVTETNYIEFAMGDTVAHASNMSFDAATFEIWGALLNGARLIIVPAAFSLEPQALAVLLKEQQVSVYFVTTALFNQMAQQVPGAVAAVEQVLFGGEAVEPRWVRQLLEQPSGGPRRLLHMYGPTESTTYASWHEVKEVATGAETISIGRGLSGAQLYVLDGRGQLVPVGVTGELYIGGEGLARGYFNRSELTAERFVPHGYSDAGGARLYRTGDLVRYREDGAIEYMGRVDHQVKLRGFRIELGEIEAVLRRHPEVEEAVVMLSGDGPDQNKRLVAYLVSEREPNVSHYQTYLRERLPEYMVPAVFVRLEQLPLTANGKLDRGRLPDPGLARPNLADEYARAETEVEQALVEVWADVLGLDQVGIDDNFFELGGDSIRSIQLVAQAQERDLTFSIQLLFENPTIRTLAQFVDIGRAGARSGNSIAPFQLLREPDSARMPEGVEDAYPLTRMQSGILFHTEFSPETSVYRDLVSNHIRARLDAEAMKLAVTKIIERHPVLRTSFHLTGFSEPLQLVHQQVSLPLEIHDLQALSPEEQNGLLSESFEAEKVRGFDCEQAPLLRLKIYRRSEDSFQFMLSLHHVIIDGWSLATMLTELFHYYWYFLGEVTHDAGPPPQARFSEFVALERIALESEQCRQYWLDKLSDSYPTKLPRWRRVGRTSGLHQVRERRFDFPPELFEGMNRLSANAGVPLKSALLAAHLKVLELLSGQQDLVSGMGSHGRPEGPDGVRVLGLFLNILPCRLKLAGGTWTELIRAAFDVEREMMPHSRFPLVEIQKLLGQQTIFESVFNFLHYHVYQSVDGFKKMELLDERSVMETNFPLIVTFHQHALSSGLTVSLMYDDNELHSDQVAAIEGYIVRTLTRMSSQPSEQCGLFSPLSDEERHRLLFQWNDTQANHPRELCVHQVFEEQAERRAEVVAISYQNCDLTYGELNRRANQLAHRLRALGIGPEVRVGLAMQRSPEMIVGLLAILKAGGAYVPLDPAYPAERLR